VARLTETRPSAAFGALRDMASFLRIYRNEMAARLTQITHTSPLSVRIRKQLVSRDVPIWQRRAPAQGWPVVFVSGTESALVAHIELLAAEAGAVYCLEARSASGALLFAGQARAEAGGAGELPKELIIVAALQRELAGHLRLVRQPVIWTLARAGEPGVPLLDHIMPLELYWVSSDVAESFAGGLPIELLRMLADDPPVDAPLVRRLATRSPRRLGDAA
jgi:hypothetical protein